MGIDKAATKEEEQINEAILNSIKEMQLQSQLSDYPEISSQNNNFMVESALNEHIREAPEKEMQNPFLKKEPVDTVKYN